MNEYFSVFLNKRNFKFAKHILSILSKKFGHEENTKLKSAQFYYASEQFLEAEATLTEILGVNPRKVEASLLLARLLNQKRETSKTLKILRQAEKYNPNSAYVSVAISQCMLLSGRINKAEEYAKKSTILDPNLRSGWKSLLKVFQEKGEVKGQIRILKLLLDEDPKDIKVLEQLIVVFASHNLHQKIWELCIQFEKIILSVTNLEHCAQACYEVGDFNRCNSFVDKLLASASDSPNGLMLRGNLAVVAKDFLIAVEYYSKVLQLSPDSLEAFSNLANSKSFLCDWSDREVEITKLKSLVCKKAGKFGLFEISGLYLSEAEESKQAHAKANLFYKKAHLLRSKLGFTNRPISRNKKRLGFLSSDFRNHAVGHQLFGLLDNLDTSKYEIFIFATSPEEQSEIRKKYEDFGENFQDISGLSLAKRALALHKVGLDLLIDLGGFSRGHNASLLALRPCPRQAHFLGYASTMGKELVDYLIADRLVVPPGSSKYYGERVIRMEGCFFLPVNLRGSPSE